MSHQQKSAPPLTLKELQAAVHQWVQTYGVRYFSELTNTAVLMEEVGELARLMARHYGDQSFKRAAAPGDITAALGDEMADILFVLVCLANQTGVDLETAVSRNLAKKSARDNRRHHRNPKLRPNPPRDSA
ncbi:MAG: nucleotide pyrophosphohydrolase [Desulfosarcinaceae bacterium]|nr:nucleotide pyrophosphohydrolase [Desulfosarcinaceae bacterium]